MSAKLRALCSRAPSLLCVGDDLGFLLLKMFLIRSRRVGFCLLAGDRAGIGLRGTKPVQLDKEWVLNSAKSDDAVAGGLRSAVSPGFGVCAIWRWKPRNSMSLSLSVSVSIVDF